jgi:hypothetical protein
MRGHIITEEQFLHQGIDHHIFVTAIENAENEYRFEVRRIAPGADHADTVYEKVVDLSSAFAKNPGVSIDPLIREQLDIVRLAVCAEEDIHAHDP